MTLGKKCGYLYIPDSESYLSQLTRLNSKSFLCKCPSCWWLPLVPKELGTDFSSKPGNMLGDIYANGACFSGGFK